MAPITLEDLQKQLADGLISSLEIVHKFGRNQAVGTSFVPVTMGGDYRTPQVASATALRVKAGNANDTAAGSGAQEITLECISTTGALVRSVLATAGASASSNTADDALRFIRGWVSKSGTYATATAGSHAADIVIENAAGSEDWATISSTDFPRGQTEVGVYTVPLGQKAYIISVSIGVDSNKVADVLLFKREGILKTAAPYDGMRVVLEFGGLAAGESLKPKALIGPFPELTDVGFMAKVSATTGEIDVDYEIVLVGGVS